ncbi:MAG: class I SAM-dependent methyltransferase [Proteobacteria bacterium]|nr:class I SAM-dependent methyltransferase [Pseudomonadota bacterium]
MNSILGEPKISNILRLAADVRARYVPGAVIEFGVFQGGVLAELAKALPGRDIFGYDTFDGLPPADWTPAEVHDAGEFADTSLAAVAAKVADFPRVRLVPGYFPASAVDVPMVAFAHVDFDFHAGTASAIRWLLPRLMSGAIVVFDDYDWPHCPGVRAAIEEAGLPVTVDVQFQAVYRHP